MLNPSFKSSLWLSPDPKVIKLISSSTQLSVKFYMLIKQEFKKIK